MWLPGGVIGQRVTLSTDGGMFAGGRWEAPQVEYEASFSHKKTLGTSGYCFFTLP